MVHIQVLSMEDRKEVTLSVSSPTLAPPCILVFVPALPLLRVLVNLSINHFEVGYTEEIAISENYLIKKL